MEKAIITLSKSPRFVKLGQLILNLDKIEHMVMRPQEKSADGKYLSVLVIRLAGGEAYEIKGDMVDAFLKLLKKEGYLIANLNQDERYGCYGEILTDEGWKDIRDAL